MRQKKESYRRVSGGKQKEKKKKRKMRKNKFNGKKKEKKGQVNARICKKQAALPIVAHFSIIK